jgi:hypothetical protein
VQWDIGTLRWRCWPSDSVWSVVRLLGWHGPTVAVNRGLLLDTYAADEPNARLHLIAASLVGDQLSRDGTEQHDNHRRQSQVLKQPERDNRNRRVFRSADTFRDDRRV